MKKNNYYKKAYQKFGILLILIVVMGILFIPCYTSFLATVKSNTIRQFDDRLNQKIYALENEINLQMNILKDVSAGLDFKILSNPPAYGYDIESDEWRASKAGIQDSYSVLKSAIPLQSKSFILFKNSDIYIESNGTADKFSAGYDTLWRLTADDKKCSLDFAKLQFFHKIHSGQFDTGYAYSDISDGKTYELMYLSTLSSSEEGLTDTVFVSCFDADNIVDMVGFEDDASSILITTNDDINIYRKGNEYDIGIYDSSCNSKTLNLKIHYSISDKYLQKQMEPIRLLFFITMVIFAIFAFIATVGLSLWDGKTIKRIFSVAEKVADTEFLDGEDHIAYLENVLNKLYKENTDNYESIKNLLYSKLLFSGLSEEEAKYMDGELEFPVFVMMVRNYSDKYMTLTEDAIRFLKERNADIIYTFKINQKEQLFYIKMVSHLKELSTDMIVHINKNYHVDIRGVCAICDDIRDMPILFKRLANTLNRLEFGSMKFVDAESKKSYESNIEEIIDIGRQLHEIIRSGNVFEARRIVYEQWYKISQGDVDGTNIEHLFFSLASVLFQISAESKLSIAIPKFDSEKDVVSLAFEITECIESICEKLNGGMKKEDVRASQIIEYIEQRYTDSSFYMPELVGKFEMSDRAIVQMLKKATGNNFSNYLGRLRIAKAQELLTGTNYSVSEIASNSGFDSANSLYKAFKKVYGVSPTVYRENRKRT